MPMAYRKVDEAYALKRMKMSEIELHCILCNKNACLLLIKLNITACSHHLTRDFYLKFAFVS